MIKELPIRFVRRYEIDNLRWDQCISEADNGLIYAYSFYLDHMSKQWDALVLGNYEAVMPLTSNKKWSIPYLYQPPFVQQLGIFSKNNPDQSMVSQFIEAIKKRFHFAEIFLNSQNAFEGTVKRSNYVLDLHGNYPHIRSGYKQDLLKNLKRLKKLNLRYASSQDYTEAIRTFRQLYGSRIRHVTPKDYHHFNLLCKEAQDQHMLQVRQVLTADNEILAWALLFKDNKRLYNVMSSTSPKGRRSGANHFLFEELIKEYAGTRILLDFEGSEISGIAKFYQKFGAVNQPYYFLRYNNLSKPLKWIKK
jgi:hypothetical protein